MFQSSLSRLGSGVLAQNRAYEANGTQRHTKFRSDKSRQHVRSARMRVSFDVGVDYASLSLKHVRLFQTPPDAFRFISSQEFLQFLQQKCG